jgi:multidrug resistance efflux pump
MQTTRPVTSESVERRSLNAPRPRRFFRTGFFVLVGLALATASIIGSGWLHNPSGDTPAPPSITPDATFAVGFGFVDVESRVINLYPAQPGEVTFIPESIKENRAVKKGDLLFRMDDHQAKLNVQLADDALRDAKLKLAQAEQMPEQHKSLIRQQEAAIEAAKQDRDRAESLFQKTDRLFKSTPPLVKEIDRDIAESAFKAAEKVVKGQEEKLAGLKLQEPQLKLEIDRAKVDVSAKETRLAQAKYVLEKCELRAPVDGTVLRLLVSVGEVLGPTPKEPAIIFCPAEKRIIRVEVEQEFASKVAPGQHVTVQDDARQGAEWPGKVTRVSDWYLQRRHILMEPRQFNDIRTLECIVEVENDKTLKIGQRVRVTFGK